jgi:hypothetical protein
MKKATKFLFGIFTFSILISSMALAQVSYSGNGNSGFGDPVGSSSISINDDGTTITITFTKGTGDLNDFLVMYIANGSEGRNVIDGNVNDAADANRRAISNTGSGNLTFPTGFEATHGISINTGFGGLWAIPNSGSIGNNGLTYVDAVGNPTAATDASFSFSFNWSEIGLASTDSFDFVIGYGNANDGGGANMFSSNEGYGDGLGGSNPGLGAITYTSYFDYPSGDEFDKFQTISGSDGWRILSTPTSDNTYDDLLGDLWTQGIGTGADVTNGTANVQLFNTSTDNFAAVTDLTATMTAGTGFLTYVYSDDDYDGSAEGFPKTLSLSGTENTGTVTPTLNDGADAWTLVGNPYASTIDWDLVGKTEVTGTVYVYDHSYGTPAGDDVAASGSAGSYRVWNGTTGSLTDGLITPFQGFWVQNASSVSSPELSIEEADKSTGGTFYKQAAPAAFALKAEMADMMNDTYFSFTQQGALGRDNFDGYELAPLDFANYMSVSTAVDGESFDINNLPISLDEAVEIPLQIAAYKANIEAQSWTPMSGEVTLSWPTMSAIPQGWSIQLKDYDTGVSVDLLAESAYSFELKASASKAKARSVNSVINPMVATKEKTTTSSRFAIMIAPTTSVSNETEDSPAAFALEQNYPNPFNPSTTISYSVQEAGAVSISVYNLMGQKVATLVDETKVAGQYNVRWNAAGAASGMYYYRLEAGGQSITRKMTLIK